MLSSKLRLTGLSDSVVRPVFSVLVKVFTRLHSMSSFLAFFIILDKLVSYIEMSITSFGGFVFL